ncbi:MAG: sugar transferase [Candidatus Omnitrophica bacterium]|nr:sugar transferase [Candidatus Omnitrophota bacterium]MDD5652833.1 sugar transferase [Candidatus Omnitrophota bacterium]
MDNTAKRIFDFIFSLCGIILSLPVSAIIFLLILLNDGWPVFYFQERVGKNGKLFKEIKFRSMVNEQEEGGSFMQAKKDDSRVTRIGRFLRITAMDELPQLWNILKGEMSFVGPRALVACETEAQNKLATNIFDVPGFRERSKVCPGLTGVAQVYAPRDIERELKFKYDIWYIRNRDFFLDLYLILLSFLITFRGKWEDGNDRFHYLGRGLKYRIESQIGLIKT